MKYIAYPKIKAIIIFATTSLIISEVPFDAAARRIIASSEVERKTATSVPNAIIPLE